MKLLPFIPEQASTLAVRFEYLFWYITAVCGFAGLAVYAFLFYCCVKYRRGATTGSTPRILGSARLELAWTIIPTIIFFTFFGWGVAVYNHATHAPADALEVFITGKQWMWKAQYPGGQRLIIGGNPRNMTENERESIGRLVIPVGRPVKFTMMSEDVIHSFGIPAFRIKIDVLPLRYTTQWHHPTKVGEYHLTCNQYCGTWHSLMVGKVAVVSEDEFRDFLTGLNSRQGTANPVDGSPAQKGRNEYLRLGCNQCHTGKNDAQAPSLEAMAESRNKKVLTLRPDGSYAPEVINLDSPEALDAYILKSIIDPRAQVAQPWNPVMPGNYHERSNPEDLNNLVQFIKSLKRGQTPDRTERWPTPLGAPNTTPKQPTSPEKKP